MSHRVGRELSFFSSRRNWESPNPSPAGECAVPPSPGSGGRGTFAGDRGGGRVPIPTRGHTLWYSLLRALWYERYTRGNQGNKTAQSLSSLRPADLLFLGSNINTSTHPEPVFENLFYVTVEDITHFTETG